MVSISPMVPPAGSPTAKLQSMSLVSSVFLNLHGIYLILKILIIPNLNTYIWYAITAESLGFDDYIPPYASARGEQVLRGVNYASAAAGIRQETGQQLVTHLILFLKKHAFNSIDVLKLVVLMLMMIRVLELILRGK